MTTNTPQVAINDIGSEADLIAAIDETIKYFNDGDTSRALSSRSTTTRSS